MTYMLLMCIASVVDQQCIQIEFEYGELCEAAVMKLHRENDIPMRKMSCLQVRENL